MATLGVFDSGLGGLTVLRELLARFPRENFIYLGDTARLPYGTKSPETIRKYSEQIMDFLTTRNVDGLVIACHTASSQVSEQLWKQKLVFNVLVPGAEKAVELSRNRGKKIGLLGTRTTIQSDSYPKLIEKLDANIQVFSQACPLLVPLAEEGWSEDPITNLIVYRYLQPLLEKQVDTLLLGCTHYPLLQTSIQRVTGNSIVLVNSGEAVAEKIQDAFYEKILQPQKGEKNSGRVEILMTDYSLHSKQMAEKILSPHQIDHFEIVHL